MIDDKWRFVSVSVFNLENIMVNQNYNNKKEIFEAIGRKAYDLGVINSEEQFVEGLFEREREMSTGFDRGIAIPHTLNETVKHASIFIVKNDKDVLWDEEGKEINFIICLAIPKDGGSTHIRLLSSVARKLVDEEFTDTLLQCNDEKDIYELLSEVTQIS